MMSAADISQASLSAVHRLLPAIAESASAALPADGQAPSAGASALREQQMHALIAAAGLSANGVGHAVAASRSTASSAASSPEPSARLDQFRFGDAENWSFRAFLSNAAENTPADHGTTRFRELRRSRQGTTLLSWAGNSDSNRRDEHWTGSRWAACDTGTQGINSARDAASRTISNYCDHRQITANRASNLVITGKTFQEVFDMIRATPGQGLGFADVPAGFSGVRDTHLGARTWPAGASLRYQASTPLAHAPTFDVRDNNRVLAYPAEITAGGDARSGTAPACASVTSTNGTRLLAVADTLESLLQRMGGAPCRFNPGTLSNADGSRVNSGEANDWWSNSTLSLGRVGSAPVGASPYATYYTSNKLLRVAFGPDGRADYFSCRERASDGSTRNCVAAGSGRYAIRQLGDVRLMSLSGQPAGLGYERVLVERAGAVYYGYQNKPLAYETRRLNLTALNALFEAVGLPALVP